MTPPVSPPKRAPGRDRPGPRRFRLIAHRGGAGHAPENTLAAFTWARQHGLREVELDVRLSRDGELVVFHDERLAPKTGLAGRVEDHAAPALQAADVGRWFDARALPDVPRFAGAPDAAVTTLVRVLETFGDAFTYHVELKGREPERMDALARVLDGPVVGSDPGIAVIATSFVFDDCVRMRELRPETPMCLLLREPPGWRCAWPAARRDAGLRMQCECLDRAAAAGFAMVGVRASALSRELVAHAHACGLVLRAWGIDGPRALEHAIAVGAAGATVDWPLDARARLAAHGLREGEGEENAR